MTTTPLFRVYVPGRPPLPNTNSARGWQAHARHKRQWKDDVTMLARAALPPGWVPLESAVLMAMFVLPARRRYDLDNLIASTKPQVDGLVAAGVMVDDSIMVISHVEYSHQYRKGEEGTWFTVMGA